jgi:hypothetical protein
MAERELSRREWLVIVLLLVLACGLMLVASDHIREPAGVFDQGDQP